MAQRKTKKTTAATKRRQPRRLAVRMPFERRNYVLLLGAVALIVVGYALMLIDNARGVGEDGMYLAVDSALSLTIAPLFLLAGYLGIIYAIVVGVGGPEDKPDAPELAPEAAEA
ncbi:MAG: DUF3098 domain-containing protein [Bacteroidota bacterium]